MARKCSPNVPWHSLYRKIVWPVFRNENITTIIDSAIPLPDSPLLVDPEELNVNSVRDWYTHVCSSIACSSQKVRGVGEQNVAHTDNRISFTLAKEGNANTGYNMEEF